ncbi:hypothetical protein BJX76DRAFT_318486 [Aspergillus varians]
MLILKLPGNNISKKAQARIADSSSSLVDICRLFQDTGLRVEILSLYESNETRIPKQRRLFGSRRRLALVDDRLVPTGLQREQCFSLFGDHSTIIKLQQTDGQPHQGLQEWMRLVLGENSHCLIFPFIQSTLDSSESGHFSMVTRDGLGNDFTNGGD